MMTMKACHDFGGGIMMIMKASPKPGQRFIIKKSNLFEISQLYGSGRFKRPDHGGTLRLCASAVKKIA
jgi:hypothetical protein